MKKTLSIFTLILLTFTSCNPIAETDLSSQTTSIEIASSNTSSSQPPVTLFSLQEKDPEQIQFVSIVADWLLSETTTKDGGYLVADVLDDVTPATIRLTKYDQDAEKQWEKLYNNLTIDKDIMPDQDFWDFDFTFSLDEFDKGYVLTLGKRTDVSSNNYLASAIILFDQEGNVIYTQSFKHKGITYNYGYVKISDESVTEYYQIESNRLRRTIVPEEIFYNGNNFYQCQYFDGVGYLTLDYEENLKVSFFDDHFEKKWTNEISVTDLEITEIYMENNQFVLLIKNRLVRINNDGEILENKELQYPSLDTGSYSYIVRENLPPVLVTSQDGEPRTEDPAPVELHVFQLDNNGEVQSEQTNQPLMIDSIPSGLFTFAADDGYYIAIRNYEMPFGEVFYSGVNYIVAKFNSNHELTSVRYCDGLVKKTWSDLVILPNQTLIYLTYYGAVN